MNATMGPFNTREIATGFWLVIFLVWALPPPDIRRSFAAVLQAFFRPKILISALVIAL